jgi:DNA-binding helix-hairpin-helix protein with protein kinase domain
LRPRVVSTNEDDEFFVEKVVGWCVERGREYFSIKWAGYSEDFNTWEDSLEKRREIPDMIEEYFTEFGFDDEVSRCDGLNDQTYVNRRKRRRFL